MANQTPQFMNQITGISSTTGESRLVKSDDSGNLIISTLPAGTNNIGIVNIDKITGISSATVSADNAAATITLAAPAAGVAHYVWGIVAGFAGGAATKLLTVKDDTTVKENVPVVNMFGVSRHKPLKITDAKALEVSMAASGTAGVIGYVTLQYETR